MPRKTQKAPEKKKEEEPMDSTQKKELFRKRVKTVWKKPKELATMCGIEYILLIKDLKGDVKIEYTNGMQWAKNIVGENIGRIGKLRENSCKMVNN